jgi:LysR substrate binding domain.
MKFNGAVIALEAAAGGLGVAMARKSLVEEEISGGRLVQVLPGTINTNWRHYALTLPDTADWPPCARSSTGSAPKQATARLDDKEAIGSCAVHSPTL